MAKVEIIHGGDAAIERRIFTTQRDYAQLMEIARKNVFDGEAVPQSVPSAWFRAVLEVLYLNGYELIAPEAKVLPFERK